MLAQLGYRRVVGSDISSEAVRFCAEKGLGAVFDTLLGIGARTAPAPYRMLICKAA
jgi:hypothetical protein